ncbi:hypothetical protein [Corallococcus carmarthensis]|uniref:Uncharacterized protein n=1 Tax=Corallococcus carmarthensis TaxID=2316728 RepID=A0A3A8KCU1_9BACT|nr:hypothetical protein [Corallococcus carmarthensis]RKH04979.1 hypothetical protein D7X32_09525 [Corallococcus carmarthensis]
MFTYAGDAQSAPQKNILIEFRLPVFEYQNIETPEGNGIVRNVIDIGVLTVPLALHSKEYHLTLDDGFITGSGEGPFDRFTRYVWQTRERHNLEELSVGVAVRYLSNDGKKLGEDSLEFIYHPKLEADERWEGPGFPQISFEKVFIAVNKAAFARMERRMPPGVDLGHISLMDVISILTDLTGAEPAFDDKVSDETKRRLFGASGDAADRALEFIKQNFQSLYDFPLKLAELKTLVIAGTLTSVSSDGSDATRLDFLLYDLSVEFSEADTSRTKVLHAPFGEDLRIQQNAAPFSFQEARQVLFDNAVGPVQVTVKGFDGSLLWSKEFAADDPELTRLDIKVPRQRPSRLTPKDLEPVPDKKKRLRGQVIELTRKCPLKDLTVLVQAKGADDAAWRIVGAATTDASGNFSMPYPFGIFTQAQALVSARPDEPATLAVTDVRDGNQTLADDFLYLLVKELQCPHAGTKEACDCQAKKQAARLPDQADLIESDEYSQDIGGACINLSTPNRTLSEYSYQAIVRTSDPDVANYTLKRVEVPQPAAPHVFSDITHGVSALEVALNSPALRALFAQPVLDDVWAQLKALGGVRADASPIDLTATLGNADTLLRLINIVPPQDVAMAAVLRVLVEGAREVEELLRDALRPRTETRYELEGGARKRLRKPIDLDNPVAWQDDPEGSRNPSLYQAVSIATGHLLHYKSVFKADGYSLGDLLYSLPLAPGQKKEIVVFDASHTLSGAESQALTQGERLASDLVNERVIASQLAGSIREAVRASSSANTSGISAGFGTGGSGAGGAGAFSGSGSAVLGVAGGVANANANAAQDSTRDVSQFFNEKLRQSIMQNAESYRQLTASVITTVQEGQRYAVTSEVVANHNHCHALTMMYFEVLRHFAIFQELSAVEECVFVPLLMTHFTTQNIFKWRDVLASHLLPMPSETYLQPYSALSGPVRMHPLLKAFDANERIKTDYANVDFPRGAYDDEPIRFIKGDMRLRVELPRPRTRFDRIMSLPVTTQTITTREIDPLATTAAALDFPRKMAEYAAKAAATAGLLPLFERPPVPPGIQYSTTQHEMLVREAIFDSFMKLDANYQSVPPAQCIRITHFSPPAKISAGPLGTITPTAASVLDFFAENEADKQQWSLYAALLGYSDVLSLLNAYFKGNLISEWDAIFNNDIAPLLFEKLVANIGVSDIATDFSSRSKYKGGERLMMLSLSGTTSRKRSQLPQHLRMAVNNATLKALQPHVTLTIEGLTLTYSTAHYDGMLFSGSINDDLLDDTLLFIPENADEKRNPRKDDAYLVHKLIEHLNSNLEHYNKALWYSLDPDRRYMLLDGFHMQIFDGAGNPAGFRSLASVVKNELITITGNSLVFPVAAGYKVSQSYITEERLNPEAPPERATLFDHYKPLTPVQPYRISVPSKGVFAEAIQGACNACEKIETERLQDWTRLPNTDEPTPILPVTPPTPSVTDWKAVFKDFATPLVSIQNAPAAPQPGAGLAGLSELLGKSGVFKDITGLEGTQQNVMKTYLSNQENAKAFAEMAKDMAIQAHNTHNAGKIMDALKGAKDSGALSEDDYNKLVKEHLQQQIDGGATQKNELAKENQAIPSPLTQAAVDAAGKGKDVRAQATAPSGSSESVDIKAPQITTIANVAEAEYWRDLITFLPGPELTAGIEARNLAVQKLTDGYGDVNLDWFQVDITKLPNRPGTTTPFDDAGLFEYLRKNFADFLQPYPRTGKPRSLETYEAVDAASWASATPLGSVLLFTIDANPLPALAGFVVPLAAAPVPELGLVLCSEYVSEPGQDHHWNFTTLKGPNPIRYHPVSGTRQFGLGRKKDHWTFYVRAADRTSTLFDYGGSPLVFSGADEYWDYLQTQLIGFVESNGGAAKRGLVSSKRYDWRGVNNRFFGGGPITA